MATYNAMEKAKRRAKLKQWIIETEGTFDIVLKMSADYVLGIQAEEITGNDAFQQLRMLHMNQGKVEAIKEFFDQLEAEANSANTNG